MKINLKTLFNLNFTSSFLALTTGIWMLFKNSPSTDVYFSIAIVTGIIYILIALYEINSSNKIKEVNKLFWTLSFIASAPITGLVYMLIGRKRIE